MLAYVTLAAISGVSATITSDEQKVGEGENLVRVVTSQLQQQQTLHAVDLTPRTAHVKFFTFGEIVVVVEARLW